jgi:hypothetical protein
MFRSLHFYECPSTITIEGLDTFLARIAMKRADEYIKCGKLLCLRLE